MDEKIYNILNDMPVVIPRILFTNYRNLNINEEELVVIIEIIYQGGKVLFNPDLFVENLNMSKRKVMEIIISLQEKNILSIEVDKKNRKTEEYLSVDLLYKRLTNIVMDVKEKEIDNSIFSIFENELGRTLSPIEYEKIRDWMNGEISNELIIEALKEAVLNGVNNFRYIDSIIKQWVKKGFKTKNDIIKDREIYRSKKEKVQIFDTDWLNNE